MDNGHEPASKADLGALEQRLKTEITDVEQRLKGEITDVEQRLRTDMKSMEDRLVETFRDSQTEVLRAFYGYAESTDLKLRDHAASDATLRDRMTVVERRLTDLEKKVHFPHQP